MNGAGRLDGEDTLLRLLRPFAEALDTPGTRDIVVNEPGEFGVEGEHGVWTWHKAPELTYRRLDAIATLVASRVSRKIGPSQPTVSSFLPGGERIKAVRPPAAPAGHVFLSIRRRAKDFVPTLPWLESTGYFNAVPGYGADWWQARVDAGATILVGGSIGSSKTTFAEALIRASSHDLRIATIEEAPEWLNLPHRNWTPLYFDGVRRTANDCADDAKRMRPDDIHFQELIGPEAWGFYRAQVIGHRSIGTIHAADCASVFDALVLMIQQSQEGRGMDGDVIRSLLRQHIDIVAHCARDPYRVTEVMEVNP